MTESKIRIAVIGLGWVALHRHIPSLLRNPAFELAGVADRHTEKAAAHAERLGLRFSACAQSMEEIPWIDSIDAVTIGAPPHAHARLAIAALDKGKHVLTEKPFAMNVAEGRAMVDAARRSERVLAIVHNFQFSRAFRRFESELREGTLGNIRRIAAVQLGNPKRRLPIWYEELPLGLFFDESPHFFYLLSRLAGKMELCRAHALPSKEGKNTPSLVHLLYKSDKGFPVTIDCQFDSSVSEWFLRITCDKATILIDIFRDIYIRLPDDGTHGAASVVRTSLAAISQHLFQHVPNGLALSLGRLDYGNDEIFTRFAHAIKNKTRPVEIDFEEGLRVLELQEEALAFLQKNMLT